MTKLFFSAILFFGCITVVNAQVETMEESPTGTVKVITAEDILNARPDTEKMKRTEKVKMIAIIQDSMRLAADSIADTDFASQREDWKMKKSAKIDSVNNSYYSTAGAMTSYDADKRRAEDKIFAKADIPASKYGIIRAINERYTDTYEKMLQDDMALAVHSSTAYAALAAERKTQLTTAVGKSKSKKLEKAWESHLKDKPEDARFWVFSFSLMEETELK